MMTLEAISAHLEIRQALARYSRGVDRWDVETLRSVYHPDGTDDHSVFVGLGWDFAQWIVDYCTRNGGVSQHHITHSLIELHGAVAQVESYYICFQEMHDEASGAITLLNTGGRYLDRFEQRDGAWKIARRLCTIDWSRGHLPGDVWEGMKDFPPIGPKGVDPVYALLAETT